MNLSDMDPSWAWSPYQPSADNPWDLRSAAHLFRRAGFGASRKELQAAIAQHPSQVIDDLVLAVEPERFRQEVNILLLAALATGNTKTLAAQWVYRMLTTPTPLREKMTLFWHGHFATSAGKVEDAELMQQQNDLLRQHALGDFSQLLLAISQDPAMLIYLDSVTNRKAHPNENYAREIMELFALGEGNYTERDIRELARCFTGWEIKRKKFRFNRYQNDRGEKTVLGQTGHWTGEDGVAIVASQPSASEFIAGKLVKFFVMDEPQPSQALLQPLARELRDNAWQIGPTVRRILSSNLFFSNQVRARKIRSPVDFGIGFLRTLEGRTDSYLLAEALEQLGQGLYYPPSVKGWDGGRTWINSSTLLGRSNLIRRLLSSSKTRFGGESLADYLAFLEGDDEMFDWIETALFAVEIPTHARQRMVQDDAGNRANVSVKDRLQVLCTLPEFQLA